VRLDATIACEDGATRSLAGEAEARHDRFRLQLPLPPDLPAGYHLLKVAARWAGGWTEAEQSLVVAPTQCVTPAERIGDRRVFGLLANLYAARDARDGGIGDLSTLAQLARWAGKIGAAFVGVNPLHALRNRGLEISPYGPVSRLYRSPLYLDLEAIPELAYSPAAEAHLGGAAGRAALARFRRADRVAYDEIREFKGTVLRDLFRAFAARHLGQGSERGRAFAAYAAAQGDLLTDFATFQALEEHHAARPGGSRFWRDWPVAYQDPRSEEVAEFRAAHAAEVDFHRYVQFELDRQLGDCSRVAGAAGLELGLYADLAIGTSAGGSDPWAFPGLFRFGASLGAPPDAYAPEGQDWGLPPVDPLRLRLDRYRYWIAILRAGFAHAGGLRIDHVMGLLRQFWIPAGRTAADGAYMRFPVDDLLGILALESRRHGAIVIGEDLGTVPAGFGERLARWGILSCSVLRFERGADGAYLPSSSYSDRALVSATTHDLPPLAGFWAGRDLEIRRKAGLIADGPQARQAAEDRERERWALVDALRREGHLPGVGPPTSQADLCAAVHAFLAQTRSPLLGASLDDLAGEVEPVNVPGLGNDRYPNWSRRMGKDLDAIASDPGVTRGLEGLRARGAKV
jgi:4-alpha-glucanotransferase